MKMRVFFSASLVLLSNVSIAKHHQYWSYQGSESPEYWGELSHDFAACKTGKNQSPVDLHNAHAHSQNSLDLIHHQATHFKIENNGHTLQATPLKEQTQITIDGTVFTLKQFHFHTPSEHTFKGKHFAMEAHFVHQSAQGELAVLSTFFKEGAENPALISLTAKMLKAGESVEQVIDPVALFPKKTAHFRLNGSLTTPPCSEGVHWIVYKNPVTASATQIAAMKAIIGQNNNRPVQPMNSRIVIENK